MSRISNLLFNGLTEIWQYALMSVMYLLLFASITALILMVFFAVKRARNRRNFSSRIQDRFARSYHKRLVEEEKKWLEEGEQEEKPLMYKFDRLIEYSGIHSYMSWLTSDIMVVIFVVIVLVAFFIGYFTKMGAFVGFLVGCAVCFVIRCVLRMMADNNYEAIETDLLKFVNAVDSVSGTNDDIVTIFREVSQSLCRPLRKAVERCCGEATSTGDVKMALRHLELSVENSQFKVIIRNLQMASETSADYSIVLEECRLGLREHIAAREERKAQISNGRVALLQLVVVGVIAFFVMGMIVDVDNIFVYLWSTFFGKIVLVYNVAAIFICLMDAIMMRGKK